MRKRILTVISLMMTLATAAGYIRGHRAVDHWIIWYQPVGSLWASLGKHHVEFEWHDQCDYPVSVEELEAPGPNPVPDRCGLIHSTEPVGPRTDVYFNFGKPYLGGFGYQPPPMPGMPVRSLLVPDWFFLALGLAYPSVRLWRWRQRRQLRGFPVGAPIGNARSD